MKAGPPAGGRSSLLHLCHGAHGEDMRGRLRTSDMFRRWDKDDCANPEPTSLTGEPFRERNSWPWDPMLSCSPLIRSVWAVAAIEADWNGNERLGLVTRTVRDRRISAVGQIGCHEQKVATSPLVGSASCGIRSPMGIHIIQLAHQGLAVRAARCLLPFARCENSSQKKSPPPTTNVAVRIGPMLGAFPRPTTADFCS